MILQSGKQQLTITLLAAAFLTGTLLYAQSPAPATSPTTQSAAMEQTLDQLIPDLGASDSATRQAASERLNQLPFTALPALRQRLSKISDPETAARLQALIEKLEEDQTLSPTLITLDVKNASIDDVIDALTKQTPYPVKIWPERGWPRNDAKPITLQVQQQPLLSVLAQISHQTPLIISNMGANDSGITVQGNGEFPNREAHSDTFFLGLTSINRNYDINLTPTPGTESPNRHFTFSTVIFGDPRLTIIEEPSYLLLTQVTDSNDNSLLVDSPTNKGKLGSPTRTTPWINHFWNFHTELAYPTNPGTKITSLKGEAHFIVQSRTASVTFTDLKAVGQEQNLEGMQVILENFKGNSKGHLSTSLIFRPKRMPTPNFRKLFESPRNVQIQLCDDQDRVLATSNGPSGGGSDSERKYEYGFSIQNDNPKIDTPTPTKLKISLPTKQKEIILPFEFKDIPIP